HSHSPARQLAVTALLFGLVSQNVPQAAVAAKARRLLGTFSAGSPQNTPPETSGTAFFTFGLAWGVHAGVLKDPAYRRAAERGWSLLTKAVRQDGKLGWV